MKGKKESKSYTVKGLPGFKFEKDTKENKFNIYPPNKEECLELGIPTIMKKCGFVFRDNIYQRKLTSLGCMEAIVIDALKIACGW